METEPVEILVVEDSATQAARLRHILERHRFRVRIAKHGIQALEELEKRVPRLVISDIVMPEMDGYELCRRIKSDARFKHLPVILLTSLSDLKDVVKGLECFADSFVVKPYEEQHVLSRIEYILANEKLRAERVRKGADQETLELYFAGHSHVLASIPKVENAIDLLLGAYETLVEKNTALAHAKEEAERANRAKSEFLSRMSHELRTPMNAVLGYAQLLEMDETDSDKRSNVRQILRGGHHLLDLINEVLDISGIEAGRMTLSPEAVSVKEVLEEILSLVRPLGEEYHVQVGAVPLHANDWHVVADRQRLKQVLLNLMGNAIKYNRMGGSVNIDCTVVQRSLEASAGATLRISVIDTGPGISVEKQALLFTPFERLGAEQAQIEGTGLGLALSKRMVELMGGTIGITSTLGEGSIFWVELAITESPVDRAERLNGTCLPAVPEPTSRIHTVIYIEDNLSNLHLIERILKRRKDINLVSAPQGRLGLDLVREHSPDVVLLDLNLPDVPGRDVLARLQGEPKTSSLPVIVISADATPGQLERLKADGAYDYVTKPLDVRKFLAVLDQALEESHKP